MTRSILLHYLPFYSWTQLSSSLAKYQLNESYSCKPFYLTYCTTASKKHFPLNWSSFLLQGFSTGLPERLQLPLLRTLPGLENCSMLRPAYAVEYDFLPAHQCSRSLMTKKIDGLFFSGQINGTTGYEEAAAQVISFGVTFVLLKYCKKHYPVNFLIILYS